MTLYEYLKNHSEEEITVTDEDFDCENYWYYSNDDDEFEIALMNIAKKLNVIEILENEVVICNISKLIENNLEAIKNKKLFCYIEDEYDVMECFDEIVSGYVSENWIKKFVNCLN